MNELEKEYRYIINDKIIKNIRKISTVKEKEQYQIDLTFGYAGFESLYKFGYICRIRKKGEKQWLEVKRMQKDDSFIETKIHIDKLKDGIDFFYAIGMKPYMYMIRKREILKYNNLKIFIDDVDLLGKFVEIEFQDEANKNNIDSFLKMVEIDSEKMPLYGDIINEKLKKDNNFKREFDKRLKEILENKI